MSQAVICNGMVFLAGQVGEGDMSSVASQTRSILEQIDALLREAGTSKEHLLSASIWLANIETFAEMNSVWDQWVAPGNTPARATVEARLASPVFLVEIAVTAAIP
jgi:enamine deaminase RidA (YjgF/YER057c/UK114 family)